MSKVPEHSTTDREMSAELPGLSAEVFYVPLEDSKYIVYAPARRSAFVGNRELVQLMEQIESGALGDSNGLDPSLFDLLRALDIVGAGPEIQPSTDCHGDPEPVSVTLLLTTACNLRCTYCYASAGGASPQFMTLETAKSGIDFVAANAVRRRTPHFEVGYHGGGEPTMHWRVLTESWDYAHAKVAELNIELHSSLATNGLLSDERVDWIISHLTGASLSCDGLPDVHDRCRRTPSGEGSSAHVIRTLRRFDAAKFSYGVRLTVTAEHISMLPASVEFLCSEFHPSAIQVEPVYLLGRGAREASAESDEFIAAYRVAAGRAAAYGRQIRFSGARLDALTNHFCGASQDNFCLSADGNVTACYEAFAEDNLYAGVFFYGRPAANSAGYVFDHHVLGHLRDQAVEKRDYCRQCFAKWGCGGDCYYKWLVLTGGGEFRGSARCHVIRELTKDLILEKIAASGGLSWHEPPVGTPGSLPPQNC